MRITIRKGSIAWWIGVIASASMVVAFIYWMLVALIIIS